MANDASKIDTAMLDKIITHSLGWFAEADTCSCIASFLSDAHFEAAYSNSKQIVQILKVDLIAAM